MLIFHFYFFVPEKKHEMKPFQISREIAKFEDNPENGIWIQNFLPTSLKSL